MHDIDVIKAFCNPQMVDYFPLICRSNLRELSNNPIYTEFELILHSVRHMMMTYKMSFQNSMDMLKNETSGIIIDNIEKTDYLKKTLLV